MLKFVCYSVVLSLLVFLSGCGGEDDSSERSETQVVAKVNGEEITVHELNQFLSRVRVPDGDFSREELEKRALDSLIEKKLVLQAAIKAKLDREPAVLSALEEAKSKVLIERYVQRALEGVSKPTEEQVKRFYEEFPERFSERKMYVFTKLAIATDAEEVEELILQVKAGRNIDDISAELKQKGVKYQRMSEAKNEGSLADPIFSFLSALQAGDTGYLKMSDGLLVVELHKVLDQSVGLGDAKGVITQQLLIEKRKDASKKLVGSLKETAEIEYVGKFAPKP